MTVPLIAVAVLKNGRISPHAGRAVHWDVYTLTEQPERVWSLHLTKDGCLHEWHVRGDGNRHPLHSVDVALCGSAGEGVTRRLAQRDTQLLTTAETDPLEAIAAYLAGTLPPAQPHDEAGCLDPEQRHEVSAH